MYDAWSEENAKILLPCANINVLILLLSFQIYQSSVAYSPDAIQTSGGYFHLGRVFLMEGKMDIADSLHSRVKHDNLCQ